MRATLGGYRNGPRRYATQAASLPCVVTRCLTARVAMRHAKHLARQRIVAAQPPLLKTSQASAASHTLIPTSALLVSLPLPIPIAPTRPSAALKATPIPTPCIRVMRTGEATTAVQNGVHTQNRPGAHPLAGRRSRPCAHACTVGSCVGVAGRAQPTSSGPHPSARTHQHK